MTSSAIKLFSLFPSSPVCGPAFAFGPGAFAAAQRAFVTALLLFGLRNHGGDWQPPSVAIYGHEGEICSRDLLARGSDVVLHQNSHANFHGRMKNAIDRRLQDHHVAHVYRHEEVNV